MKILVINGPNLNMLGIREPDIYGRGTYHELVELIGRKSAELQVSTEVFQSNCEGEIIDKIHDAYDEEVDGIIINAAAYTHTSIAIADALKAVSIPYVEVHISDIDKREEFRKISYLRDQAVACISGKGFEGYIEALMIITSLEY